MAEIIGIGISHYPPLSGRGEDMANILKGRLADSGYQRLPTDNLECECKDWRI